MKELDPNHPIVQEWIDTIVYAITEAGITLLDTAPWYGHGTSETVIGWALQKLQTTTKSKSKSSSSLWKREDIMVNTKVGRYEAEPSQQFDYSYATTLASVQRSIQRMSGSSSVDDDDVDGWIDVVQLHDPEFAPNMNQLMEETIPALLVCRDDHGWCRALGMTGYPLSVQHQILQQSLQIFGNTVWSQALTYGHYNLHDTSLFNRTFITNCNLGSDTTTTTTTTVVTDINNTNDDDDKNNDAEAKWSFATYCAQQKLCLLAAAPLSMGLLTPQGPPSWHPASSSLQQACHAAAQLCAKHNVDFVELATIFALAEPCIPCTILGLKNRIQVQAAQDAASRIAQLTTTTTTKSLSSSSSSSSGGMVNPLERLKPIMTHAEYTVLTQLQDPVQGPFAQVWAEGGGRGDWDGLVEVQKFWSQLPDRAVPEWQQKDKDDDDDAPTTTTDKSNN